MDSESTRRVQPAPRLRGELRMAGDKSISHRALILNALADGEATVSNLSPGEDCRSTLRCLRQMGVKVEPLEEGTLRLTGSGLAGLREPDDVLDAGNSGTTARLLSGVLAGQPFFSIMTGDASLRTRPMKRVVEPLRRMGAQIWGRSGDSLLPMAVKGGRLRGMEYVLPVASAQLKSAILLAALFADGPTLLREPAPSRDHTERMLRAQGVRVTDEGGGLRLDPLERLAPIDVEVPGDISSAAFWLVAAAIHPDAEVTIRDVGLNPGRTGVLDVLREMGAKLEVVRRPDSGGEPVGDVTVRSSTLRGVEVGGEIVPRVLDEIPVLAVAAAHARGETRFRDAGELRVKETDRIAALAAELDRLGAKVDELPDGLIVSGGGRLRAAEGWSHGDHRIAMALAVAGLVASGETAVRDAAAVDISYPGFWSHLAQLSGGAHA